MKKITYYAPEWLSLPAFCEVCLNNIDNGDECYWHGSGMYTCSLECAKKLEYNIISKMDWQVIASGEVKGKYQGYVGDKSIYNIENKILLYQGKDIEIAVRVKE